MAAPRASPPPAASQRIIGLEEGWERIDREGLQKLFRIIQTGSLSEQLADRPAAAASPAAAAAPAQPGFTNDEYAQLYT